MMKVMKHWNTFKVRLNGGVVQPDLFEHVPSGQGGLDYVAF